MLETHCRFGIRERCEKVVGKAPIVYLKGGTVPYWEYEGFWDSFDSWNIWDGDLVKKLVRSPSGSVQRQCLGLFSRHGDKICDPYIKERFGDWETAIKQCGTFKNLVFGFEEYFRERKTKFMEKTDQIIEQIPKELTKVGKIKTSSHGGVANLLKVLTKTMHEQGSTIRTIAKVQYAVCVQAGIYIPDEFITDVLVAADIDPDLWKQDEEYEKEHERK